MLITYHDLVDHVLDYYGADPSGEGLRYARRAVLAAVNVVPQICRWSHFYNVGQFNTVAHYTTGTIAYDHTGGAFERLVTLTSGTWPSWASLGRLVIDQDPYDIATRESDTQITLSVNSNPGQDVASGTTYTIYQDTYALPSDFLSMDRVVNMNHVFDLRYQHPGAWLNLQTLRHGPATPRSYTITGSPDYQNTKVIRFFPPPDNVYNIQNLYERTMRPLKILDYNTGTMTVGAASTSVTGSGTAWTSSMVGSILRIGEDSTNIPTGLGGETPYQLERVVTAVGSATTLTIDAATGTAYSGVKYRISDPVDVAEGSMYAYLLRECERQARIVRRVNSTRDEQRQYEIAKQEAMEADSVNFGRRAAGAEITWRPRYSDMPQGPDES